MDCEEKGHRKRGKKMRKEYLQDQILFCIHLEINKGDHDEENLDF